MTPVGVFFICQNEDKCHFVNSTFLSRGLGGFALSGTALSSLGGRPLPGLAVLSFSVGGFCLTAFFS